MKIQIMSDIHLEFGPCEEIKKTDADVVVLAGDIHTRNQVLKQGLEWIISNFGRGGLCARKSRVLGK
jgi:predicted phosphodiesterase